MNTALDGIVNWLHDHKWLTCLLLCTLIFAAGKLDWYLP